MHTGLKAFFLVCYPIFWGCSNQQGNTFTNSLSAGKAVDLPSVVSQQNSSSDLLATSNDVPLMAYEYKFDSSSSSSDVSSGWVSANIFDQKSSTGWSSAASAQAASHWIEGSWLAGKKLNFIRLLPRTVANVPLCLPVSVKIEYRDSANNLKTWGTVNLPNVNPAGGQKFNLPVIDGAKGIRLSSQGLRPDNTGGYYFQLAELRAGYDLPIGAIEYVDSNVVGFAYDSDNPSVSIGVHFYIDGAMGAGGTFIGSTSANIARSDVNNNFGISGNHGYSFPLDLQYKGRSLFVYGIDTQKVKNPVIVQKLSPWLQPVGTLEHVSSTVDGYAFDPDNPNASINMHFYVNGGVGTGTYIGQMVANLTRPDVNAKFGISGAHGFSFPLDPKYRGRELVVYALDNEHKANNPEIGRWKAPIRMDTKVCSNAAWMPGITDTINLEGTSVGMTMGIAGQAGGIPLQMQLYRLANPNAKVEAIDPTSNADAAMQISTLQSDAKGVMAFNQGAGKGTGKGETSGSYGFVNEYAQSSNVLGFDGNTGMPYLLKKLVAIRMNPLWTDFLRPPSETISHATTPCSTSSDPLVKGLQYDTARQEITMQHVLPALAIGGSAKVVRMQQKYYQVADSDYTVTFNKVLQWWELKRTVAQQNNLRVYLIDDVSQAGPYKLQDLAKAYSTFQKCPYVSGDTGTCKPDTQGTVCECLTAPLKRIVLVWQLDGQDIGLSVHRSNNANFQSHLRARDYNSNGIIGIYSVLADTRTLGASKTMIGGQLRTYEMTMDLGTRDELMDLGMGWK